MTSSHELEVRHYWRTSQALNKQRREGAPVSEMADNLDEIDTLAQVTSHPHIRALCLAALTVIGGASASTAATLASIDMAGALCCAASGLARVVVGFA